MGGHSGYAQRAVCPAFSPSSASPHQTQSVISPIPPPTQRERTLRLPDGASAPSSGCAWGVVSPHIRHGNTLSARETELILTKTSCLGSQNPQDGPRYGVFSGSHELFQTFHPELCQWHSSLGQLIKDQGLHNPQALLTWTPQAEACQDNLSLLMLRLWPNQMITFPSFWMLLRKRQSFCLSLYATTEAKDGARLLLHHHGSY